MIPWRLLDKASLPGDGAELRLMQRGAEFSIMCGSIELMNSRLSGSEAALAALGCAKLRDCASPHVLIGGLGMGFTLRATLAELGPAAAVTVAELSQAVVNWAGGHLAAIFGDILADPRVDLRIIDVGALIGSSKAVYDAILLDVDNGPRGLTRRENDGLYDLSGLRAARRALRAGGVLALWSSTADEGFTQRLRQAGYAVALERVRARGEGRGARHVIWVAS